MENPEIYDELLKIKEDVRNISNKQSFKMIAILLCLVLIGMIFIAMFSSIIITRIESINKSPAFNVVHGWYQDPVDPKRSGLKMIRVSDGGFMMVAPVQLTLEKPAEKPAEKTPEPKK